MPKRKKDPSAPKRPRSAYNFFMESEKESRADEENFKFSEFSKQCSEKWAELEDEDRLPFLELNDRDKARYETEMSNYHPPAESNSDSDTEAPKQRKRKKRKKDPNAPKRGMTAYFIFAGDVRPEIRKENPGEWNQNNVAIIPISFY